MHKKLLFTRPLMRQRDIFSQDQDRVESEEIAQKSNLEIENGLWASGFQSIAGVDEVGRGPLAGPVVACACILPPHISFPSVQDSKVLSESDRKKAYDELVGDERITWAISIVDHQMIDKINILRATLLAMKEAVEKLIKSPDFVLVDGRDCPPLHMPHQAIIKGDVRSQSIAAASIIAKVTRDELMDELDLKFPEYGFIKHKGYGTAAHLKALQKYGASPIHRKSFAPIQRLTKQEESLLF
jgi:ribonuclease HII